MANLTAVNGNLVLKLVEDEEKSTGGLIMTTQANKPKNRAVVISGGELCNGIQGDIYESEDVRNGDTVIFNTRLKLEDVDNFIIVPHEAILAILA